MNICFAAPSILLLTPKEASRRVSGRELLAIVGLLLLFVGLVVLLRLCVPDERLGGLMGHPVSVVAIWVAMMAVILLRWRRERAAPKA